MLTAFYFVALIFAVITCVSAWLPLNAPAPAPWPGWSWRFFTLTFLFYLLSLWRGLPR